MKNILSYRHGLLIYLVCGLISLFATILNIMIVQAPTKKVIFSLTGRVNDYNCKFCILYGISLEKIYIYVSKESIASTTLKDHHGLK